MAERPFCFESARFSSCFPSVPWLIRTPGAPGVAKTCVSPYPYSTLWCSQLPARCHLCLFHSGRYGQGVVHAEKRSENCPKLSMQDPRVEDALECGRLKNCKHQLKFLLSNVSASCTGHPGVREPPFFSLTLQCSVPRRMDDKSHCRDRVDNSFFLSIRSNLCRQILVQVEPWIERTFCNKTAIPTREGTKGSRLSIDIVSNFYNRFLKKKGARRKENYLLTRRNR